MLSTYCTTSIFYHAVDILESVGLRDGSLMEDGATLAEGPTRDLDAFRLSRPLSAFTNTSEWQILRNNFPSQFAFYAEFDASDFYNGTILSINDGAVGELSVAINSNPQHETTQTVTIQLPQSDPEVVLIYILGDTEPAYQRIGFTLRSRQLNLYHNCSLFYRTRLDSLPLNKTAFAPSLVTIFGSPTRVSALYTCA